MCWQLNISTMESQKLLAPCLIPSNFDIRKESSLQSKKSTKTFGRKKPDKLEFHKYANVQSDLVDKQKNLELEDFDKDDEEVFVFPDAIQKELDAIDAAVGSNK